MKKTTAQKNTETKMVKRQFTGVVTSDKMKDTIVVQVERFVKHPKYGKYVSIHKKFHAHDAGNTKKAGEIVVIEECAPISKTKRFTVATA